MKFTSSLITAALSATVASNFVIVTIPSPNIDIFNIQSQYNSLTAAVASRVNSLTASLPSSALSQAASAQTALMKFVATAPSSLSIPASVTAIGGIATFTSTPAWYTALPSDLKSYYDGNNAKVQSVVNDVAGGASRTQSVSPKSTGAASNEKVVQYLGVGAAAAIAGVFAL